MNIDRPIIIVGTGRCGSTMLHRVLAMHEDLGWTSTFNEVFPTQPWLSRFSNLYRHPLISKKVKHYPFFPKPFEAYKFWEHYLPGFSRRDKPQVAADVLEQAIDPVHRVLAASLKAQDKKRFLIKVTGWSRIGYFNRIFPDAVFVFLKRGGRSVVSSWVQAGWLDVTSGLDSDSWQWGDVPDSYQKIWRELGGDPLLSAALKVQLDIDDIHRNMAELPGRCYELQYEDLIAEPEKQLQMLIDFCQLDWTTQFADETNAMTFYNSSDKWKQYLSEEEGDLVVEFFRRVNEEDLASIA